jgi:hypothetical protein
VTIFLYVNCVITAGAVLSASYAVAAVKRFVGVYRKSEKSIAEGIICCKDKEDEQRRKKLVASPIKVELRRL